MKDVLIQYVSSQVISTSASSILKVERNPIVTKSVTQSSCSSPLALKSNARKPSPSPCGNENNTKKGNADISIPHLWLSIPICGHTKLTPDLQRIKDLEKFWRLLANLYLMSNACDSGAWGNVDWDNSRLRHIIGRISIIRNSLISPKKFRTLLQPCLEYFAGYNEPLQLNWCVYLLANIVPGGGQWQMLEVGKTAM